MISYCSPIYLNHEIRRFATELQSKLKLPFIFKDVTSNKLFRNNVALLQQFLVGLFDKTELIFPAHHSTVQSLLQELFQ